MADPLAASGREQARNVAIIIAVAVAVWLLPGAETASEVLLWTISALFWVTLAWFGAVQYRERRETLYGLGDRRRAVVYGSIAVIVFALAGTTKLWASGPGVLIWIGLIAGSIFLLVSVVQSYRSY